MRTSLVALVLVGGIAVAVVASRFRPADSIAGPLLPQADQPPTPDAVKDEPQASIQQTPIPAQAREVEETPAAEEGPPVEPEAPSADDTEDTSPPPKLLGDLILEHDQVRQELGDKVNAAIEARYLAGIYEVVPGEPGEPGRVTTKLKVGMPFFGHRRDSLTSELRKVVLPKEEFPELYELRERSARLRAKIKLLRRR